MKKRVSRIRVNTKKSHSDAMLKTMLFSLLRHGKLETTSARAKVLKRFADREIAYALSVEGPVKKNQLVSRLGNSESVSLMNAYVEVLKGKNQKADGSFVKIMKTRFRAGDNAEMSEIVLDKYEELKKSLVAEEKKRLAAKKKKKPSAPAKRKRAKEETKSEKEPREKKEKKGKILQKKESTAPTPEAPKKPAGLLDRLGGRILGRQVRPDAGGQRGRSTARSGI